MIPSEQGLCTLPFGADSFSHRVCPLENQTPASRNFFPGPPCTSLQHLLIFYLSLQKMWGSPPSTCWSRASSKGASQFPKSERGQAAEKSPPPVAALGCCWEQLTCSAHTRVGVFRYPPLCQRNWDAQASRTRCTHFLLGREPTFSFRDSSPKRSLYSGLKSHRMCSLLQ